MKNDRGSEGSIDIIGNSEHLYEGTLDYYFEKLLHQKGLVIPPKPGERELLHITSLCYDACSYYGATQLIGPRCMRDLVIAGIFCDFYRMDADMGNVVDTDRALDVLHEITIQLDHPTMPMIKQLIKSAAYPYLIPNEELTLCGMIIRDAETCQSFNPECVQQILNGLSSQWGKGGEVCLSLHSDWAKDRLPEHRRMFGRTPYRESMMSSAA